MRRWQWVLVLVLVVVVSACGGGTADTNDAVGASDVVVESADNVASLSLAEGSLPDGTSPDDLVLTVAFNEGGDVGFPVMAVELLPQGLALGEPARLTIRLPAALDGGFMAIHQSGSFVEFLDGEVTQDNGSLMFSTSIEHFSLVYIFKGVVTGSMTLAPNPVSPDQVQVAEVTVNVNDPVSLLMGESACQRGCHGADFTLYEFSVSPISFRDSEIAWGEAPASLANWDPAATESEVIEAADHWEAFASSRCIKPNTSRASSRTGVIFNLTLLGSSEVSDIEFLEFVGAAGVDKPDPQSDPFELQRKEGELSVFSLEALRVGDTFRAASFASASAEAICTEIVSSTLDTTPQERSSSNSSYNIDGAGQPGSVAVNGNDCFGDNGPAACTAGIDITGVAWEPVAGAPDQLKVTVTFAGPVGGTEDFLLNMGIRGNESAGLGTNYIVEGDEVSWSFPGSDGALPGESVSVDDQGRLVIIRDVSSLTGIIRIDIKTNALVDPRISDAVQISNVIDRG